MMLEKKLIEKVIEEDYLFQIYKSSNCNDEITQQAVKLIEEIKDIYRFKEPSHFKNDFIVCIALNNKIISKNKYHNIKYDKTKLLTINTANITIQIIDQQLYMWTNLNKEEILKKKNVLYYIFKKDTEYFLFNNKIINILPLKKKYSIYSQYFDVLENELTNYKIYRILNSSCEIFNKLWADEKRIYFKSKPEEIIQTSLTEYLRCTLRNQVEVVREYNINAKKPVDLRIHWGTANRNALIEVKWLGVSLNKSNSKKSTEYTNSRAADGMKQLKEYLDLMARDTPGTITKGYLVIIDGRRKGISKKIVSVICEKDGLYFESKEISIPNDCDYSKTIYNFEPPIRMFARPICQ